MQRIIFRYRGNSFLNRGKKFPHTFYNMLRTAKCKKCRIDADGAKRSGAQRMGAHRRSHHTAAAAAVLPKQYSFTCSAILDGLKWSGLMYIKSIVLDGGVWLSAWLMSKMSKFNSLRAILANVCRA